MTAPLLTPITNVNGYSQFEIHWKGDPFSHVIALRRVGEVTVRVMHVRTCKPEAPPMQAIHFIDEVEARNELVDTGVLAVALAKQLYGRLPDDTPFPEDLICSQIIDLINDGEAPSPESC